MTSDIICGMEDLSEEAIRKNCPHCAISIEDENFLEKSENFYIVCDGHPIAEGHILIIPKKHISCVGAFPENLYKEFVNLNDKVSKFVLENYGSVSSFEHGIFGQTVFHSHVHYLPFDGKPADIVPENKLHEISDLSKLKNLFKSDGGYLFFSIDDILMSVDVGIATPRFFRDRYATFLNRPERGNWKSMRSDKNLMDQAAIENHNVKVKWEKYF